MVGSAPFIFCINHAKNFHSSWSEGNLQTESSVILDLLASALPCIRCMGF